MTLVMPRPTPDQIRENLRATLPATYRMQTSKHLGNHSVARNDFSNISILTAYHLALGTPRETLRELLDCSEKALKERVKKIKRMLKDEGKTFTDVLQDKL